jgi:hypothetical protein
MSNPDTNLIHQEARQKIKNAMEHYPGDDRHVAVFAAMYTSMTWNDIQVVLSRDSIPSSPTKIKQMKKSVEAHVENELRNYIK